MPADPTTTAIAAQAAQAGSSTPPGAPVHHEPFLTVLLSNPLHAWIISGATLLGLIVVVQVFRIIVLRQLERLAKRTSVRWDDLLVSVLRRIKFWLIFPALVYASAQALALPEILEHTLRFLAVGGLGVQLLLMAGRIVDAGLEAMAWHTRSAGETSTEIEASIASSLGVARAICMGIIGLIVILLALDNLGVKITPMLTGLGIGGIAVALAVQNILGDLFGSLTIILDKPFVVGDLITVGDKTGTVERIGIKTTRVRAQSGEQLVFSNSDLLSSRIQNFKRMQERRVAFTIGVVYDTPVEKVRRLPDIIREAIELQKPVRFDRCHFRGFGPFSLEFEAVYFVLSPEYRVYMDCQQAINLHILASFVADGVELGLPTQPFSRKGAQGQATTGKATPAPNPLAPLLGPSSAANAGAEPAGIELPPRAGAPPSAGGNG